MSNPSTVCFALGDPIRWRISLLLHGREVCVCELMDVLNMAQSSLSSHLKVLREAGLIKSEKRDKWTYYRLAETAVFIVEALRLQMPAKNSRQKEEARDLAKLEKRIALRGTSCSSKGQRRAIPPPLERAAP
jgi:ArsR family transcriptional regulator